MSELRKKMVEYLKLKRELGFKMRGMDSFLRNFVIFMEAERAAYITTDLALRWAKKPNEAQPVTLASRFQRVRHFALWLSATDSRTQVPPAGLLPKRYTRKPPYVYREKEIAKIICAASRRRSARGLKGHTYSIILGLLAVTGMRCNEALALDRGDVNLDEGILHIRQTKFGKSRLVPVHDSTCSALKRYARLRDRIVRHPTTQAFFTSEDGVRITHQVIYDPFRKVLQQVGLHAPVGKQSRHCGPTLHDMRHSFAVRTLINWYRAGRDVERELPKLATYLGHVHISGIYWYLEAVPELLQLAARRSDKIWKEVPR